MNYYAPKHNPMVYFDDVTGHERPQLGELHRARPARTRELATDLATNNVARYNFITPNLCNDMHDCVERQPATPGSRRRCRRSSARARTRKAARCSSPWTRAPGGDVPIGMIALSPLAKPGYSNSITYTHSSTLRTMQEIFGVTPLLGDAANATDLRDLFKSFP